MKIFLPTNVRKKGFWGLLRDVTRYPDGHWEIKISTELSNLSNMYIGLNDDDMLQLKQFIEDELVKVKKNDTKE